MGKAKYTYEVTDAYNCFGAGHHYCLSLYKKGKWQKQWLFDSILGIGNVRLQLRINWLKRVYSAEPK